MVCYDILYDKERNLKESAADKVINVWIFKNNLLSFFPSCVRERWQVFMIVFVAE